jgi:hypothetical protein
MLLLPSRLPLAGPHHALQLSQVRPGGGGIWVSLTPGHHQHIQGTLQTAAP